MLKKLQAGYLSEKVSAQLKSCMKNNRNVTPALYLDTLPFGHLRGQLSPWMLAPDKVPHRCAGRPALYPILFPFFLFLVLIIYFVFSFIISRNAIDMRTFYVVLRIMLPPSFENRI